MSSFSTLNNACMAIHINFYHVALLFNNLTSSEKESWKKEYLPDFSPTITASVLATWCRVQKHFSEEQVKTMLCKRIPVSAMEIIASERRACFWQDLIRDQPLTCAQVRGRLACWETLHYGEAVTTFEEPSKKRPEVPGKRTSVFGEARQGDYNSDDSREQEFDLVRDARKRSKLQQVNIATDGDFNRSMEAVVLINPTDSNDSGSEEASDWETDTSGGVSEAETDSSAASQSGKLSRDDWQTGSPLWQLICIFTGVEKVGLDPCSGPNSVVQAERVWKKSDNGLLQSWESTSAYINPPFSHIRTWFEKWIQERHKINGVSVFVFHSQCGQEFHRRVFGNADVVILFRRISFVDVRDGKLKSPPFSTWLAIDGPMQQRLRIEKYVHEENIGRYIRQI